MKNTFGLQCRRIWAPKVFLASNAAGFEHQKYFWCSMQPDLDAKSRFAGEQRRRPRRLNGWPTRVNDEREHQPKGCFKSGSREEAT
ncbi:MAG: hypothetical protein KDA38_00155, partial [Planctomycetales bacterium]|nr:hypothetical protein [Planctomycetales bacterium]